MELEEMKSLWNDMSARVEKLEIVNKQNIMKMTEQKYRNTFSKMMKIELVGFAICLIFGVGVLFNLDKMNTWYLLICGIVALVCYLIIPSIAILNIKRMNSLKIAVSNQKTLLTEFAKRKKRLLFLQRYSGVYALITMFVTLPVISMISNNEDFFLKEHSPWLWVFVGLLTIGVLLFSRYGYSWYKKTTASAEATLMELGD